MRATEARLREALEDRASQVTDDTLVRNHADPTRTVVPLDARRDNRRNRVLVLAAAAVAFILAGFSWLVIVNRQSVPAKPLPTVMSGVPSPSRTATAPPVPDTSHVAGDYAREAIPWSVVGAGWSVALRVDESAPTNTLLLVSPWGARYTVGGYKAIGLMDVSRDGTHALLGAAAETAAVIVDMTTGAAKQVSFAAPSGWTGALVQPDGSGLFILTEGSPAALSRYDSNSPTPVWSAGADIATVQTSPDGRYAVGSQPDTTIAILDAVTGVVVAELPAPAGTSSCTPYNWWSDDEIVISCASSDTIADVWRYSLSARTMTRISRGSVFYIAAYPTSLGVVVQHSGGCDTAPIGVLSSDGTSDTPIAATGRSDERSLIAVVGTTAYLVYTGCNANKGHTVYVTFDLVTHATVTLMDVTNQPYQGWIILR